MAPRQSSTVRGRRLRRELHRLRTTAGLTTDEVAEQLTWHRSKVSRIENGHSGISPGDVRELLDVYGVTGEQVDALVKLAREARQKNWWFAYGDVLPDDYVGLEAEAVSIRTFEGQFVPGLLQTEGYARAVIHAGRDAVDADDVERRVEARLARQTLLTRDDPVRLWAIVDEGALRRPAGGREVMRAQLDHLAKAAELPNVELQVLPYSSGAHAGMSGPFAILNFVEPAEGDVVYVENETSSLFLEKPQEIERYTLMFTHLLAKALDPDASVPYLARLADEL